MGSTIAIVEFELIYKYRVINGTPTHVGTFVEPLTYNDALVIADWELRHHHTPDEDFASVLYAHRL